MSMEAVAAMVRFEMACVRIMQLREALDEATRQRNQALLDLHHEGIPKCHVGQVVRNYLLEEWSAEDVKSLGLSDGSIRLVFSRPEPDRTG